MDFAKAIKEINEHVPDLLAFDNKGCPFANPVAIIARQKAIDVQKFLRDSSFISLPLKVEPPK